jgi:SAM-dependent methyltransferase
LNAKAQRYWDEKATQVSFTHPLNLDWLVQVPQSARILDYGCGYGRTLAELTDAGWRNCVGVDFSLAMIARGRRERPDLRLCELDSPRCAEPDAAFELALLFAVLTTIADEADQLAVMAELRRLLEPGGWLYLSDYLVQADERSLARYRAGEARHGVHGVHGVWDREDGGVFRHQTREGLNRLLAGFEVIAERQVETNTFSGAKAVAIQVLAQRRADARPLERARPAEPPLT